MSRARVILARVLIVLAALTLPPVLAVLITGQQPASLTLADLNAWAPIKSAGPSTELLASGVTRLAGPGRVSNPDWFTAADQSLLDQAESALRANKLQEGLGHLMVLSSHLEERGKNLNDFLPLVVPDLAAWLVANYFASILLGVLLVLVGFLVFMPWLARRLIDALKVVAAFALGLAALVGAIALCLTLSGQRALIFTLIEYLTAVVLLTVAGNTLLFIASRAALRRRRHPILLPPGPGSSAPPLPSAGGTSPPRLEASSDHRAPRKLHLPPGRNLSK